MMISSQASYARPLYTGNLYWTSIPWVSGFILPVIPFTIVFEYHWLIIFLINIFVVFALGPILTRQLLIRFASGKGLGKDMLRSFVGGLVSLVTGLATI